MAGIEPRGAHLVGSVPLASTEEVFVTAAEVLGSHVRRIPDGETGARTNWIHWQYPKLLDHPDLETDPDIPPRALPSSEDGRATTFEVRILRTRPGVEAAALVFESGYAEQAIASYGVFAELKRSGRIPSGVRFQVSVPTPLALLVAFITPGAQLPLLPAFERSFAGEIQRIAEVVPHEDLAIQWDVCLEVLAWEGLFRLSTDDPKGLILSMLGRLGDAVPREVELGYHLCYGDPGHRHIMEPKDAAVMTEIANGIARVVERQIQWLHLPVPKDRTDDPYFAPLRGLVHRDETELYLGLVHRTDGLAGARARIDAARRVAPSFGVATECGFGRRPADTIRPLMELHAECSRPIR